MAAAAAPAHHDHHHHHATLHYFEAFHGRSFAIKLACAIGRIDYTFAGHSFPEFGAMKDSLPLGSFPVVEIDHVMIPQTQAILRFFGRSAGLYPACDVAALKVDAIMATYLDVEAVMGSFGDNSEERAAARAAACKEGGKVHGYFAGLEKYVAGLGGSNGFLVGSSLTIADLLAFAWWGFYTSGKTAGVPTDVLNATAHPRLAASGAAVAAHPAVRAFLGETVPQPKIQIKYFPSVFGRAFPLLLTCAIGGIENEFVGLDMAAVKGTTPLGQVPVITIDGVDHPQTSAILRYLGKRSGLYPKCHMSDLKVDAILNGLNDLEGIFGYTFALEQAAKEAERAKLFGPGGNVHGFLTKFNRMIGTFGGSNGCAVGSTPTIADVQIFAFVAMIGSGRVDGVPATYFDDNAATFPHIVASRNAVAAIPAVTEFIAKNTPKAQ